ncbi:hypothetical protein BU16DRAFT_612841 [Lophium mytilinum]|uniref:P-loop containing nucleoside triphosphate hydrolase protein n=1 Tax=Lophium mytilinum TaxID=390894 RepID=A0A6A6RHQ9_9PEZI|nr:hypothetical protein BU16DRAFT_612841 [Lophium mytilinum]
MAAFGAALPADAASLIRPDEIATLIAWDGEHPRVTRVMTGCRSVDEALEGKRERGIRGLCCFSGEAGAGKTGLALAFLTSHLLENPRSQAAIIDTSGNFDVLRLHTTLVSRFQRHVVPQQAKQDNASLEPDDIAAAALERVKIMRVFDFVGMKEALEELKEEISQPVQTLGSKTTPSKIPAPPKTNHSRRVEVADSEDEEDEEEEEMLFVGTNKPDTTQTIRSDERRHLSPHVSSDESGGCTWMLIVDNITEVLSPLMKVKYVQAHAMLASLMRDLSQLARSHDLTSLVINSGITRRPPPTPADGSRSDDPDTSATSMNYFTSSAFEACTTYPALGKTFPFLVDMHFMISRLPKEKRGAEMAHAIEILSDGWEGRAGRLAFFQCNNDGGMEAVVYRSHEQGM